MRRAMSPSFLSFWWHENCRMREITCAHERADEVPLSALTSLRSRPAAPASKEIGSRCRGSRQAGPRRQNPRRGMAARLRASVLIATSSSAWIQRCLRASWAVIRFCTHAQTAAADAKISQPWSAAAAARLSSGTGAVALSRTAVSWFRSFLMRSLASEEMDGHGSSVKSGRVLCGRGTLSATAQASKAISCLAAAAAERRGTRAHE